MSDHADSAVNGSDPSEVVRVHGEVEPAGGGRHLPVPVRAPGTHPLERVVAPLPAPVVAATGGFLAGIVTFVVVRLLRRRRSPRALPGLRGKRERPLEIAGSRSFLVDVRLLKR